MSYDEFIEVQERGSFSCIQFRGDVSELSLHPDDVFEAVRRFASEVGCAKLAIDVSGKPYIPSSMLGMLVRLHTQEGLEVHLINASGNVEEIIRVTHLDRMIHVNQIERSEESTNTNTAEEASTVALGGYFISCPHCQTDCKIDKHDLGTRVTCESCSAKFNVSAEMMHDAQHVYSSCPDCHRELKIPHEYLQKPVECQHCQADFQVRTIV